jgi:hypothetical protein
MASIKIEDNLPGLVYKSQDTLDPDPFSNGFNSMEDAIFWRDRACGIACAHMLINTLQHRQESIAALIHHGINLKAYIPNIGWSHAGLAKLLQEYGVQAIAHKLQNIQSLIEVLKQGKSAILSVTPGLRGGSHSEKGEVFPKSGHLIIAHGWAIEKHTISDLIITDPDYENGCSRFKMKCALEIIDASWGKRCIIF